MNTDCGCNNTCPPLEPIVMPCRTCTITRCFPIEQPLVQFNDLFELFLSKIELTVKYKKRSK